MEWIIPTEAIIVEESNETVTMRFDTPGTYDIVLRSIEGECQENYTKTIIVEEARDLPDVGDADNPFISEFIAYPNPTTGIFSASITLAEEATISIRLYSLISNTPLDDRQLSGESVYNLNYNISLASGVYFLLLETPNGSEIRRVIIE